MKLSDLLQKKKSAIVESWLEKTMGTYAPDTTSFLVREKDQFANPVGHALTTGIRSIFDSLLQGMDPEKMCAQLESIIKIRAIQDFTPSRAIGFAFFLKNVIRKELKVELQEVKLLQEWMEFEVQVDQMALFAFDIYTKCREQVSELRVNEVKRRVSKVLDRINRFAPEDQEAERSSENDEPQSH